MTDSEKMLIKVRRHVETKVDEAYLVHTSSPAIIRAKVTQRLAAQLGEIAMAEATLKQSEKPQNYEYLFEADVYVLSIEDMRILRHRIYEEGRRSVKK